MGIDTSKLILIFQKSCAIMLKNVVIIGDSVLRRYVKTIVIIILIIFVATGCISRETQSVIDEINNLGEIQLSSEQSIKLIEERYYALPENDKFLVKNYEILTNAKTRLSELKIEQEKAQEEAAFQQMINLIESIADSNTSVGRYAIENAIKTYRELTQNNQDVLNNSPSFLTFREGIVNEIKFMCNKEKLADADNILSISTAGASILTEDDIKECLIEYGKFKSLKAAEELIKDFLKSPRSYYRYGGTISSSPTEIDDNKYSVAITIKYGATNSFGGEITDQHSLTATFMIDISACSVVVTGTRLSALDSFRISH